MVFVQKFQAHLKLLSLRKSFHVYLKFWKGVTHLSFTAKKKAPLTGCHVPPALSYRTSRTSRTAQKTPGIRQGGLLPPADPEGAQPWRDHRSLARVSRHEVPKTPGKTTSGMISDPARVSHLPVRQSVRHPGGVAGIEPHRNPCSVRRGGAPDKKDGPLCDDLKSDKSDESDKSDKP